MTRRAVHLIFFSGSILGLLPLARIGRADVPGPGASTRPVTVTIHARRMPADQVIKEFSKQAGATIPLSPPDLLDKTPLPPVTLDLDRQPFWSAMERLAARTGLEPVVSPEEPNSRFALGLAGGGNFFAEPHVTSGPLVLFATEVERANTVELRRHKAHEFERQVTVSLTAFVEPGLRLIAASPVVKVIRATDERGRALKAAAGDDDAADGPDFSPAHSPGNGIYAWNLAVVLEDPPADARTIARLKGLTHLRIQTASQRLEIDDVMRVRNVSRTVAGVPFTLKSLKKADAEYLLQLGVRRERKSAREWQDLQQSIYHGGLALYDEKGRLVAPRAAENGGDYAANRIDAALRFARQPGVSDPNAGEPYKLVWQAPTAAIDLAVEFELKDLPLSE